MNNKVTVDEQLQRMKSLMNYGLTESKQPEYSSVEYSKVAADGKLYGIVREGTNYFIKVAKNANAGLVTENFDYINGFRNRNNNKFESFASAQRYFGEKMMDINESIDDIQKKVITEAWDLDTKKEVIEEQTKKVQSEIARQRQIMENAVRIAEGKKQCCDMPGCPCPEEGKAENVKKNPSAPFVNVPTDGTATNEKGNLKGAKKKPVVKGEPTNESTETPLTSRNNPDFMDKSKETRIGNAAPFCNSVNKAEGAVADEDGGDAETSHLTEGEAMHNSDDQNTPTPGTGKKGSQAPFVKKVNESLDDVDDELDDEDDDVDLDLDDEDADDAEFDDTDVEDVDDTDEPEEVEDVEVEEEPEGAIELEMEDDDINSRMDSLEAKLDSILDAIQNMKYDDEPLYDDSEDNESEDDLDNGEDEDDLDNDDDTTVVESKSYRAMKARQMNEENDFGQHPAWQKKVMTYPSNDNFKRDGQYDMNDASVDNEKPYGTNKGNQAPYTQTPEQIEDAIVESVYKMLKKKLG